MVGVLGCDPQLGDTINRASRLLSVTLQAPCFYGARGYAQYLGRAADLDPCLGGPRMCYTATGHL